MKKKVIIVYEGIVREYDNACLLKAALEARGYSVRLVYKTETFLFKKNKAICILPNGYRDEDIEFYRNILNANGNILISLQYEQVFSKRVEDMRTHIPKGEARKLWLLCWGKRCYDRLLANGIDRSKVRITGALHLDLLRDEFKDFYLSRQQIASRFSIDEDAKWLLYISSFSYVDNEKLLDDAASVFKDNQFIDSFKKISIQSQRATLEWFEQVLKNKEDIVVIYRPHPVEAEKSILKEMQEKYKGRFLVIHELSVKQWIKASDIVSTWISTSIAEVFLAKKSLLLIRPCQIPAEYDIPFYINADYTDTCEKLIENIDNVDNVNQMPIGENELRQYYYLSSEPSYKKVCDLLEEIEKNEKISKVKNFRRNRIKFMFRNGFIVKLLIKKVYQILFYYFNIKIKNSTLRSKYYINDWENSIIHKHDKENACKMEVIRKVLKNE